MVKALCKGEPERQSMLIRYVAQTLKFLKSYVAPAMDVAIGLNYVYREYSERLRLSFLQYSFAVEEDPVA